MLPPDPFREQPTLHGRGVRLVPLGAENADDFVPAILDLDPRVRRLTGTHRIFTEEELRAFAASRPDHHDRADWLIYADDTCVGDCALIDFDPDNAGVGYRIALHSMDFTGRGHGTAATDAVLKYAFETVGLHRVALEVFDFNTNARRSYEKSGFVREGVWRKQLRWDGEWHDAVLMSILDEEYALRSEDAGP
ncbi:GNAT family protein [Nocardiopsis sp. NPDC006832]|uniref:GNAT family N-acetyltransferase n=1 Tax=Nocardiopsis sp. NPDC006832 TaxID=3157188 RepID=UPI0033E8A301